MRVLDEINRMQDVMGHSHIKKLSPNWKIFYEYDENKDCVKGFCILYRYNRLPYEPDYNTGKLAEIGIFTFPEYRHRHVCSRLVQQAIQYAKKNRIDIVADCTIYGYPTLKSLGFKDSAEKRVWLNCSKKEV